MATGKLRVATCQFAVTGSANRNALMVTRMMRQARRGRADIVHFSECALSGYPGADLESFDGYRWDVLRDRTEEIMRLAKELKLWVVLGSSHPLTRPHKPHNSLYLINPAGRIVDRYDKRFCTGGDLDHFTPGDRFAIFTINGIKCTLLICFDLRFPELYRQLKKQDVRCVFQSFHNGRAARRGIHTDIMRQTMQCRAATNYFWASINNSSAYYSLWPSCFIQPDGRIAQQLRFHQPGIMFNNVDLKQEFYDASEAFRAGAMRGTLHSGRTIKDRRSSQRTIL